MLDAGLFPCLLFGSEEREIAQAGDSRRLRGLPAGKLISLIVIDVAQWTGIFMKSDHL